MQGYQRGLSVDALTWVRVLCMPIGQYHAHEQILRVAESLVFTAYFEQPLGQ
jgi:hypothetical protein